MILTLLACAGDPEAPDPEAVLVELAEEVSTDLYRALHYTVGDARLAEMTDGNLLSGTYTLPDEADPAYWATDGELVANWTVSRDEEEEPDEDGWPRFWHWDVELEIARLALPSATVSGEAIWEVSREVYVDYEVSRHAWTGTLNVPGAGDLPTEWTSRGLFDAMDQMSGEIGLATVEYEAPDSEP